MGMALRAHSASSSAKRALRSAVGTPIVVDGHLWGLIAAGSSLEQPLPPDTETRLVSFTELVATAVANTDGRAALARLAEEQAALRRVATLVARATPPEECSGGRRGGRRAVGGRLHGPDPAILRTGSRSSARGLPTAPRRRARSAAGSRSGAEREHANAEDGPPARLDAYVDVTGSIGNTGAHDWGFRSSVGVPISVEGQPWGLILVAYTRDQQLPDDTEARLASFTELVATAIADTQARTESRLRRGAGRAAASSHARRRWGAPGGGIRRGRRRGRAAVSRRCGEHVPLRARRYGDDRRQCRGALCRWQPAKA